MTPKEQMEQEIRFYMAVEHIKNNETLQQQQHTRV